MASDAAVILDSPAEEITRLRACLNDLASMTALPALWADGEPPQIVSSLLDTLLGMLRLAFICARLNDPDAGASIEMMRVAPSSEGTALSLVSVPLGVRGEFGVVVAGSQRPEFPEETDRLLLNVAAKQTAIALQQARLLREQRRVAEGQLNIVDSIPGLVAMLTPAGEVDVVNRPVVEYCGQPLEAMKQWGTNGTVHGDDLPRVVRVFTQAIASGAPYDFEARIRRFDGVYRWFQVRGLPLRDTSGRILRWYVLLTDIDDRKRAEVFLAEGQRLSQTGSFSWKVETGEITWSDELYRIYGFKIGMPVTLELIRSRVHPEDLTLLEKMIEQARNGRTDFEWQYRLVMPDHSTKYLHAVAHPTSDQDGQLEYIAAVQDVTARRISEDALARARSELAKVARVTSLGVLTASIAHEVNQPLSGIITNASTCVRMLDTDPPNVAGARETAKRTIRDGNRASDVIARLRAVFSKKEFTLEVLDLNEVTREIIALTLSELQRNRVVLRSELAGDLPPVTGDRIQLQEVILNLLRNASDAMAGVNDRPRQLLVRTEREDGDRVRVTVRDAGVGLDRQNMDKLFDAFYTTKRDGMGMGLSISRSIVERHHGRIWAERHAGPGATFSFSIPVEPIPTSNCDTLDTSD
jgi:PAS domain S-box-containing protein